MLSGCDNACGSTLEDDECGECGGTGPADNFTCDGFQPTSKSALQTAINAWASDATSAEATYGHISGWDVSLITDMSSLFTNFGSFNEPIGDWDVSNVTDMNKMFYTSDHSGIFNQDISGWDVSSVTDMNTMFKNNHVFN